MPDAPQDPTGETLERLVENMSAEEIQEEESAATAEPTDEKHPSTAEAEHDEEGAPSEDRAGDSLAKVRREAASYRVKLRDTEGERDRLAGVVGSMQRAEAERLVTGALTGAGLAEGGDLWRGGVELAELLGDDGQLDHGKLTAARDRVASEHPHWRRPVDSFDGGARQTSVPADHAGALSERLRRAGGL